jgi:alanyl-tRNA synthetase
MSIEMALTGTEIRQCYLDFFVAHSHLQIPSSSLVPDNDPTVLLTTAGMQQILPYFLGREMPPSPRLTSVQKCFRTTDIDNVGNERSLTFFEMLGNFSVGDYFKHEAITFAWEVLTQVFLIPDNRLRPTIHPEDDEALHLWKEIAGFTDEEIVRLEDNWWGPPGASGPCGPDSEIYYDRGIQHGCGRAECAPGCECERFLEIWNLVFTQYYQDLDGKRTPLPKKNIDTGMGLERLSMVLQGKESVFDTDLFRPIIDTFAALTNTPYGSDTHSDASLRVIADHGRALVFLAADGVLPSTEGRGYIFRRILRRAVRHGKLLGLDKPFLADAANTVIDLMKSHYVELEAHRERILDVLSLEEKKFSATLDAGLALLNSMLDDLKQRGSTVIPGEEAFKLYDTRGFPLELTQEVAAESGFTVDVPAFELALQQQQERSRAAATFVRSKDDTALADILRRIGATQFTGYTSVNGDGKVAGLIVDGVEVEEISAPQSALIVLDSTSFYAESGGQIGDRGEIRNPMGTFMVQDTQSPMKGLIVHYGQITDGFMRVGGSVETHVDSERRADTMRNHSATHLLQKALRDLLGPQVEQRGSLVEPERLRFDFTSPCPITALQLAQVDEQINRWIRDDLPVVTEIMPQKQALQLGAMALFGEKYEDKVRVVTMGSSKELCGGTHCTSTGQIGIYFTVSETSVAAGIRRIEALTGHEAEMYLRRRVAQVDALSGMMQTQPDQLENALNQLLQDQAVSRNQITQFQREAMEQQAKTLASFAKAVEGVAVVATVASVQDNKLLREMGTMVLHELGKPGVVVLAVPFVERISLQVSVSPELVKRGLNAGKIANTVGQRLGGKGGGRPESAQGGGKNREELNAALAMVTPLVKDAIK